MCIKTQHTRRSSTLPVLSVGNITYLRIRILSLAPAGRYVRIAGAAAQTKAPAGRHVYGIEGGQFVSYRQ